MYLVGEGGTLLLEITGGTGRSWVTGGDWANGRDIVSAGGPERGREKESGLPTSGQNSSLTFARRLGPLRKRRNSLGLWFCHSGT